MSRGTTLQALVTMVREETGQSTSAALGQNALEGLKHKIRRQQEILWLDHLWPHMRARSEILLQAGDRYYNPPSELSRNHRIDNAKVFWGDRWVPVQFGIDARDYNRLNPDADQRDDPVRRWDLYQAEQIEVWPLPATNDVRLSVEGTRNLSPLMADADKADLDDLLIVMFVSAEIAARQKQPDAKAKLDLAQRHFARLKGTQDGRRRFMTGDRDPWRQNSFTRRQDW